MSIEVELNGKGGKVCEKARCGEIRCGLIVRPTSEDVLVGNVFGMLKHIRPHLWLNPLLNLALHDDPRGGPFRQVWFKDFRVRFWERQARFPPELLGFREGHTEPDVVITWKNPPTTVWIEAKYLSGFATGTTNSEDNDQVIRSLRTLLVATGHIRPARLFDTPLRRPVWLAMTMEGDEALVEVYRNPSIVRSRLAEITEHPVLPERPFLGWVPWPRAAGILGDSSMGAMPAEKSVLDRVAAYLSYKVPFPSPC